MKQRSSTTFLIVSPGIDFINEGTCWGADKTAAGVKETRFARAAKILMILMLFIGSGPLLGMFAMNDLLNSVELWLTSDMQQSQESWGRFTCTLLEACKTDTYLVMFHCNMTLSFQQEHVQWETICILHFTKFGFLERMVFPAWTLRSCPQVGRQRTRARLGDPPSGTKSVCCKMEAPDINWGNNELLNYEISWYPTDPSCLVWQIWVMRYLAMKILWKSMPWCLDIQSLIPIKCSAQLDIFGFFAMNFSMDLWMPNDPFHFCPIHRVWSFWCKAWSGSRVASRCGAVNFASLVLVRSFRWENHSPPKVEKIVSLIEVVIWGCQSILHFHTHRFRQLGMCPMD